LVLFGSPRVVDGLEEVAYILHPELFDQIEPNKPKQERKERDAQR